LLAVGVEENPRESASELARLGARLIIQRAGEIGADVSAKDLLTAVALLVTQPLTQDPDSSSTAFATPSNHHRRHAGSPDQSFSLQRDQFSTARVLLLDGTRCGAMLAQ
jgi:hypothetical protein